MNWYIKTILGLVDLLDKFLKMAVNLKPVEQNSNQIAIVVGRYFEVPIRFRDGTYYCISWPEWQRLIDIDWTDQKQYEAEIFDCDDFAWAFKSHMQEYFGINSVAYVHGTIFYPDGKTIGHLWNAMVTSTNELYFYEPIDDRWVKYTGGKIMFGPNEYRPDNFLF